MNPYAAPLAEISTAPDPASLLPDASLGARFGNFFIDSIAVQIVAAVLGFIVGLAGGQVGALGGFGIAMLASVGYLVVLEATGGRTLGKLITGTRVVDDAGNKPRLGQIVGRTFARYVPFEPFSFFGSSPRGWHDRWSGTRVVKIRP
jgi:uncharacterized RDD family membrane protein YckC